MTDEPQSPDDIEREIDRTRADLDRTLDALQQRLTPDRALDYGLGYIRGPKGRQLLDAVERNPMAVALIAVGVGWLMFDAWRSADEGRTGPARRSERAEPLESYPATTSPARRGAAAPPGTATSLASTTAAPITASAPAGPASPEPAAPNINATSASDRAGKTA